MATSNNKRDVRLGVEIETAGEESLKRLAAEVRGLAKAGDEAAPQYIQLADSLERNVTVARELAVFKQASEAITQTSVAAEKATENAQRLRQEFQKQSEATDSLRSSQAAIRTQLDATNRSVNEQTQVLAQAKAALKANKDENGELAKAVADAASSLAKFKREAADLGLDLKNANREVKTNEASLRKLADESLRADEASRSLAAGLRAQADAMERAQIAARALDADFTDVAVAQERLDAAMRDGVGMLQAAAAAEKLATEERQAAAAINALTDDIDRQAEIVRGKLVTSLNAASDAYEKEQAAIRESLALAAREEATAERKAALATRLAQLRAEEAADERGQVAARERAAAAAESELAAIRDSERFVVAYNLAKLQATAATDAFAEALGREGDRSRSATQRLKELADAARAAGASADQIRDLAAAFDAAEKQAAEAAAQVQKLQGYFDRLAQQRDVLKEAFGTTGVRSIQAIEQEVFKLQRALVLLEGEFRDGRISVADFERATGSAQVRLAGLKREIETIPGDKTLFSKLAEGADNLVNTFGRLGVVIATVSVALAPLLREFIALESTTRILTQVTGSAAEAAKQIEFLRNVAQKSGQAFGEVSTSYAKFAASALQAGLSNETVQKTFQSVALAAGNLGLNSDQAKRALEALGQIASKGTVSMEELRQQLGDALPGVLPLLAKQLGLTNQELNKLVEAGELSASSAIPALAEALTALGPKTGVVEGLVASFLRLKNVLFEAGTEIASGPLGQSAGFILEKVSSALKGLAFFAVSANEGLKLIGVTALAMFDVFAGNIKTVDQFKAVMSLALDDSAKKVVDFKNRAKDAGDATTDLGKNAAVAAPNVQAVAAATTTASTAATAAVAPQQALAGAVTRVGIAAAAAVGPQQQMASTTTQVGVAASQTFGSLEQLKVAYTNAVESAKTAADTAKLAAEARKTEVATLKEVATLTGNEVLIKRTAVDAANELAVAVRQQAEAEQKQLDLARQFRVALEQRLIAENKLDDAAKKDLAQRDEKLAKQTQAVQKTLEEADSLEVLALQAKLTAETIADTADQQDEFRKRAEETAAAVVRVKLALADGTATTRDYRNAVLEAAFWQGKLNDSINDSAKRLENNAKIQSADLGLRAAGIKLTIEELRNAEAKAKADGDESRASRLKIDIKKAELEVTKLNNEAKRQEAQASLEVTQRMLAEADAGRLQLTPEKRAELEIRKLVEQAKLKDAEASIIAQKRQEEELKTLGRTTLELNKLAMGFRTVSLETERAIEAALRYGSVLKSTQYDAEKFALGLDGGRFTASNGTMDPLAARQQETSAQAKFDAARSAYSLAVDKVGSYGKYFLTTGVDAKTTGARKAALQQEALSAFAAFQTAQAELDAARQGSAAANSQQRTPSATDAARAAARPSSGQFQPETDTQVTVADYLGQAQSGVNISPQDKLEIKDEIQRLLAPKGGTTTVNINLAGLGSTSVRVASPTDAANLTNLLRQLEAAARSAGGG